MSVPSTRTLHCLQLGSEAAIEQAIVYGSSPLLQAADQIRKVSFTPPGGLPQAQPRQVALAKPIPLRFVAEEKRLVGRDLLDQGVPFRIVGLESHHVPVVLAERGNARFPQAAAEAVR